MQQLEQIVAGCFTAFPLHTATYCILFPVHTQFTTGGFRTDYYDPVGYESLKSLGFALLQRISLRYARRAWSNSFWMMISLSGLLSHMWSDAISDLRLGARSAAQGCGCYHVWNSPEDLCGVTHHFFALPADFSCNVSAIHRALPLLWRQRDFGAPSCGRFQEAPKGPIPVGDGANYQVNI